MAISWADNVNRRILDQTTINIGEGGFVEDKSSNGEFSERRLTSLAVPDTFNVVMDFDWENKDENGLSEFDRFVYWYKYVHKRGTNAFWFPEITRFNVNGSINPVNPITGKETYCQYKITSSLKPQKSGFSYRVTMTWVEVYSGPGIIPIQPTLSPDRMIVENGHISFFFNHTPSRDPEHEIPKIEDFTVQYKKTDEPEYTTVPLTNMDADGNIEHLFFEPLASGIYFIKVVYKGIPLNEMLEVK